MTHRPNAIAQTADFEFAALNEARNYRTALIEEFQSHLHGSVLEVGAGIGQMTTALRETPRVKRVFSVEPDEKFCAAWRARFPEQDLLQGTVSSLQSDTVWNAILSVNVIEHIADDHDELARYHQLLQPARGALCLFVPARPEIYAPIDRDFGHFRRYTRSELHEKLERAGFSIHRLRYYNIAGYFAWWVNFCLFRKRYFGVSSVRFFDRAIFPAVHFLESKVCPPPIGQSLLAIATAR
jgi:SAM-dependent methyltransferase